MAHVMVQGIRYSGKTWMIQRLVRAELARPVEKDGPSRRIYILDSDGAHEDLADQTFPVGGGGPWGYNPLQLSAEHPESTPADRAEFVARALSVGYGAFRARLGAALRALLREAYAERGLLPDRPIRESRPHGSVAAEDAPTLEGVRQLALARLRASRDKKVRAAEQRWDAVDLAAVREIAGVDGGPDLAGTMGMDPNAIGAYSEYLRSLAVDPLQGPDHQVFPVSLLEGLIEQLDPVCSSSMLVGDSPRWDPDAVVRRYDVSALGRPERAVLVQCCLRDILLEAEAHAANDRRTLVVLDGVEEHLYTRRGAVEAMMRFGPAVGLEVLMSAYDPHPMLGDELRATLGAHVLLGDYDREAVDAVSAGLNVPPELLWCVVPRRRCVVRTRQADGSARQGKVMIDGVVGALGWDEQPGTAPGRERAGWAAAVVRR
ncbi:hypothetical protein [Thioalkalivibrio sp. ALE31]|uniref:hypothetical protein n=1 Tax=Thioalkalivibrio sp. ALE31 TaxID=1158182 RepID=UPI00035F4C56|nr:hypothetical protein [Thioalkalivibrio sp. ALE31]